MTSFKFKRHFIMRRRPRLDEREWLAQKAAKRTRTRARAVGAEATSPREKHEETSP
jgi:hypothetical protein